MPDRLVSWLTSRGFQPVYLPTTGLHPPELYLFVKPRLRRMDTLESYLPKGTTVSIEPAELPAIHLVQTDEKSLKGASKFLGNALRALGITSAPALDLSYAGNGEFIFSLTGVTSERVGLATITRLVAQLKTELISDNQIKRGSLHVAYEYLYAAALEMRKADKNAFEGKITGIKIENVVNIGAAGRITVKTGDALVFKSHKTESVAFAYRAARLFRTGDRFEIFPEDVQHFAASGEGGYVPEPHLPLIVDDKT